MRRPWAVGLVVGAVAAGLLAGCGGSDEDGVGEVAVGVLAPVTGDLAGVGEPGSKAVALAAREVNAAARESGVGLRLDVDERDTGGGGAAVEAAAEDLVTASGSDAIVGPWSDASVAAAAEGATLRAGIPLVTPGAAGSEVTALDEGSLVSRTIPATALEGRAIARLVATEIGDDAGVVTAHRNDPDGAAVVSAFAEEWEAGGGSILRNVAYNPEAPSLISEARQIAEGSPDAWIVVDRPDGWQRMGRALVRTALWDAERTFTGSALRSEDLVDVVGTQATRGIRGVAPRATGPGRPAFDELWDAEGGGLRPGSAAHAFDAVVLIALAAAAAGTSEPAGIARELVRVSGPPGRKYTVEELPEALAAAAAGDDVDYEGAGGSIDLDEDGDPRAGEYAVWSFTEDGVADEDRTVSVVAGGADG